MWGILAILTQQAKSMGLHIMDAPTKTNNTRSLQPLSLLPPANHFTSAEERRRAFWAIFLLNTHISLSTGWQSPISLEEIQLRLPCLETEFQMSKECPSSHFIPFQAPGIRDQTAGEGDIYRTLCVEGCGMLNRVNTWLQIEWDQSNISAWKRREMEGLRMADEFENWWRSLPRTVTSLELTMKNVNCAILLHGMYYRYVFSMQFFDHSALLMIFESIAFAQLDERLCGSGDSTDPIQAQSPVSVVSEEALNRAHIAAVGLSNVAHFRNSSPDLTSHTSPFLPLFFFIGIRYLLAAKAFDSKIITDTTLDPLAAALESLAKQFPEAGILLLSQHT